MEKIAINDAVVHVPEGVCTVTSIIERDLASLGLQPFTHKIFSKWFSWKEIEYPPYVPEEEVEPEEDRDII
jgi:hypothetical protein